MKILSIGNSFSQDAHRYIHDIAKGEGVNIKCVNLYIGGCSLQTHYVNMMGDVAEYAFEFNGEPTGMRISIKRALSLDNWDYITIQQSSPIGDEYETYTPYAEALAEYIRSFHPKAKLLIHQTWAYEEGSSRLLDMAGFSTPREMLTATQAAYKKCADEINADGIIPAGEAMLRAVELGIGKIHRDTFHASRGAGRYLLGLTWFKYLTGRDITGNRFNYLDEPITEDERRIVIEAVNSAFGE